MNLRDAEKRNLFHCKKSQQENHFFPILLCCKMQQSLSFVQKRRIFVMSFLVTGGNRELRDFAAAEFVIP